MGRIFAVDGKLFGLLSRIADLVILNLLWLLCSLPIVTIGASTTALYAVLLKMVRNEESYLFAGFLRAFKENIRQASFIWTGILLTWAVLYFDFYFCAHGAGKGVRLLAVPLGLAAFLSLALCCYVFPILAYFENSTKKAVKNALLMGIAYLPYTVVILILNLCPLYLLFSENLVAASFFDIIIGFSLAAFLNAYIFRRLFDRVRIGEKGAYRGLKENE